MGVLARSLHPGTTADSEPNDHEKLVVVAQRIIDEAVRHPDPGRRRLNADGCPGLGRGAATSARPAAAVPDRSVGPVASWDHGSLDRRMQNCSAGARACSEFTVDPHCPAPRLLPLTQQHRVGARRAGWTADRADRGPALGRPLLPRAPADHRGEQCSGKIDRLHDPTTTPATTSTLRLPFAVLAGVAVDSQIVFYAATPAAFVDLAAPPASQPISTLPARSGADRTRSHQDRPPVAGVPTPSRAPGWSITGLTRASFQPEAEYGDQTVCRR